MNWNPPHIKWTSDNKSLNKIKLSILKLGKSLLSVKDVNSYFSRNSIHRNLFWNAILMREHWWSCRDQ